MKVKSLFLMALAASMTLVSCDKSEDLGQNTDTQLKSVTVTLPNIQKAPAANVGTRAVGNIAKNGTKVALKNYKVFFLSGNTEVSVPQFEGAAQKVFFDATADGTDWATNMGKYTYHFLPAAVNKVAVVGNIATENMTWADVQALTTVDVLNDGTANEEGFDADGHPYYQLYGESTLTRGSAVDDKDHNNVYTASVNLAPRTSRFEIYGFEYKLEENNTEGFTFESVELNKIALSNYATKFNFMTMAAADTRVVAPNEATAIWDWITNANASWSNSLSTISLGQNAKKYANGTDITNDIEDNIPNGIITYGLTHATKVEENPELLLSFYGVGADGSKTPLYLRGKFTKNAAGEDLIFEANGTNNGLTTGKIYRVFFPILDNVWEQPERCIELTVTVAEWEVVPVTPEF